MKSVKFLQHPNDHEAKHLISFWIHLVRLQRGSAARRWRWQYDSHDTSCFAAPSKKSEPHLYILSPPPKKGCTLHYSLFQGNNREVIDTTTS